MTGPAVTAPLQLARPALFVCECRLLGRCLGAVMNEHALVLGRDAGIIAFLASVTLNQFGFSVRHD